MRDFLLGIPLSFNNPLDRRVRTGDSFGNAGRQIIRVFGATHRTTEERQAGNASVFSNGSDKRLEVAEVLFGNGDTAELLALFFADMTDGEAICTILALLPTAVGRGLERRWSNGVCQNSVCSEFRIAISLCMPITKMARVSGDETNSE